MRRRPVVLSLLATLVVAELAFAQQSSFTSPADLRNQVIAEDEYLWTVMAKLRPGKFKLESNSKGKGGTTVLRIEIARDGGLIDAKVISSSGEAEIDDGLLAVVRQASPYPRLPAELPGSSARFKLSLTAEPRR